MAHDSMLQMRIDSGLRQQADALFADLGFDTPTAIRIFLKQALKHRGLPFDVVLSPNAETISAMEDVTAKRNLRGPFTNTKDLMDSLVGDEEDDDV